MKRLARSVAALLSISRIGYSGRDSTISWRRPPPPGLSAAEVQAQNYGVFSARYGNVYTVRQAVQLFDRAFGKFDPQDDVWSANDGYVDAFRPTITSTPFPSEAAVRSSAAEHLACVRRVFAESDWIVLTLGLTEAWRSKLDGAVYPLAPGVSGGSYDPDRYEFVNFTALEVMDDLECFIRQVREINPVCRLILTVSPVPLIATYEPKHVLVATTYSKSALRVAAEHVVRNFSDVYYFPSYEIVTSWVSGGRHFESDMRQVNSSGVDHVMRVFNKHFLGAAVAGSAPGLGMEPQVTAGIPLSSIVCDEEAIQASVS